MSKQKNTALVLIISIVVLAATVVSLLLTRDAPESEPQSSEQSDSMQQINLVQKDIGDIKRIQVENEAGGFVVEPTEPGVESYFISELQSLSVNVAAVKSMVLSSFQIVSADPVGKVDDLSEFGLDSPKAVVTTTFLDGTQFVYYVGDTIYSDEGARYMCAKDTNYVYIAQCDEHLLKNSASFLENTVLSLSDDGGDAVEVEKITISGTFYQKEINIEKNGDAYQMTTPVVSGCAAGLIDNLAFSITNVAGKAVEVHPSAGTLKKYGLHAPPAVVRFVAKGESYQLSAAKKDDDTYYLMREGVPVIYEVAADSADAWAATSSFSLRDKKLTEASADTVQTLTVKTGGKTVTFTVSRTRDDEKSTELIAAYQYSVKAKGEPVPVEGYQNAMAGLAALSLTGETDKGYDAQPSIIIIYTTFENGEHTMKFYPLEKESYAVWSDGQRFGVLEKDGLDTAVKRFFSLAK